MHEQSYCIVGTGGGDSVHAMGIGDLVEKWIVDCEDGPGDYILGFRRLCVWISVWATYCIWLVERCNCLVGAVKKDRL